MTASVTAEELVESLGIASDALLEWEALGFLDRDDSGRFGDDAVERARLLRFLAGRGISANDVQGLIETEGDVLGRWIAYLGGPRGRSRPIHEVAKEAGLDSEVGRRMWRAAGFGSEHEVFDRDVGMFRTLSVAMEAGLPEEALVQLVRVYSDAIGRVADAEARLFHFYVHERLRREGVEGEDLADATTAAGDTLMALIEPTILYFHRLAWERAIREDMTLHLAEELAPGGAAVGQLRISVLFVDIASFTPLTDAMGDTAATGVLDRLSDLVREEAGECDGRVIKQIGDEFMLLFPSADRVIRCGLELARRVADEDHFPAIRMGAHTGTALFREADYFGADINIAARVAGEAGRGEFLVTDAVRDRSAEVPGVVWEPIGQRRLKGLSDPVELFRVRATEEAGPRPVDPVCGMHIESAVRELRLDVDEAEVWFCSERCRDRFLVAPDHYLLAESDARNAGVVDPDEVT